MSKSLEEFKNEHWEKVPEKYGPYYISTLGNVRRERSGTSDGRVLKFGYSKSNGYLQVHVRKDNKRGRGAVTVHKLMGETFLDLKPGFQINHIDGNKKNNNLKNLEVVNQSKNQLHRCWILNKRNKRKVNDDLILKIKEMRRNGFSYKKLAKLFGYTPQGIKYICIDNRGQKAREALKDYASVKAKL